MPPAGGGFNLSGAGSFIVNLGTSYLMARANAQDGPRLKNLAAGGGEYGTAMPRLFGDGTRITGIFIAQADIKETRHTVEDYSELVGAATGAIEGFMLGGPIGAGIGLVAGALLGAVTPNQHYYTYSDTFGLLLADRSSDDPIEGVTRLWANGKLIFSSAQSAVVAEASDGNGLVYRKYGQNHYFKSLTVYGGGPTQTGDAVLAGVLGEQPGYRGSAYIVVEDLQLAEFGESVPPLEGLVVAKAGESLAAIAETIAAAARIDIARTISTSALVGQTVRGYAITGESSCWDALKPLLPVFRVDAAEAWGQIRFYKRGQAMRSTIPPDDMGAHAYGDDPPERIRYTRASDLDLPRETSFTFVDPGRDWQQNTASSQRSEGNAASNVSVSLALTLTPNEGASAAAVMHWDAWLGRTAASFALTDRWIGLEPGVAYGIAVGEAVVPFRITRRTRGANGIIECEALSDESVTYHATIAGTSGTVAEDPSTAFADTRVVFIDAAIIGDLHDDFGFYVAVAGSEPQWVRGQVQISADGTTWGTLVDTAQGAVIGDVTGTLAAGSTTGLDDTLDTVSVLTVVLLHDGMTLATATDAELDAWANFAFVGADGSGEYVQFKTATKLAPKTWQLTNLRRGRRGSDWAIGGHGAGEEFVLLGGEGVFRIVYADPASWGVPMLLRGVSLNQDPAEAVTVGMTNTGEGKRPYSPVNVAGSWDGGYNLAATFDRRSRFTTAAIGTDAPESYEIDILNAAGTSVVRTIAATAEAFTYSAAQAVADGVGAGTFVRGNVYQLNADRGRGHRRPFLLIGPLGLHADTTLATADTTALTADYN